MKRQTLDCTAGRRALRIAGHPELAQRVVDATNPRYGKVFGYTRKPGGRGSRSWGRSDPERDALAA